MIVCFAAIFGVIEFFRSSSHLVLMVGALVALLIFAAINWFLKRGSLDIYRFAYKSKVIKKIFSLILPEASYQPDSYITSNLFTDSKLFSNFDRYSGDDLAIATIGKTKVHVSEVHSEIRSTTTDSKGRTRTSWKTQFKGFFIIADFHKHFNGCTLVRPDSFGGIDILNSLSNLIGDVFESEMQNVELESVDFEKEFKVTSTDQVTARYILTPQMMEGILKFKETFYGSNMYMSFIDGKVNIAVSQNKNNFEPRIYKPAIDFPIVHDTYKLFENIFSIIDYMNLNTRIWTKK